MISNYQFIPAKRQTILQNKQSLICAKVKTMCVCVCVFLLHKVSFGDMIYEVCVCVCVCVCFCYIRSHLEI